MQVPLTLYLINTLDVCHAVGAKQWVAFESCIISLCG